MYTIYKITNIQNNKIYVGQTKGSMSDRLKKHIYEANHRLNTKFSKALRKYGSQSFTIEKIDEAGTKEEANSKEIYWIKELKSMIRGIGYNSTEGGDGGNTYANKSENEMKRIRQKISNKLSGENNGNHRVIYVKNILTNDIKRYGSIEDFCRLFNPQLNRLVVRKRLEYAKKYNLQSVFMDKYIFSDSENFSSYTNFQTKQGETPRKVTDLLTGESFYGISLRECAEHFGLKDKRKLETKRYKKEFINLQEII